MACLQSITECHSHEHQARGGLVHWQDAKPWSHSICYPWWHEPKHWGYNHACMREFRFSSSRVPITTDLLINSWCWCSAGLLGVWRIMTCIVWIICIWLRARLGMGWPKLASFWNVILRRASAIHRTYHADVPDEISLMPNFDCSFRSENNRGNWERAHPQSGFN